MRDSARIDGFCNELAKLWHRVPDMRFGQFINNVLGELYSRHGDTFYTEDDKIMDYINEIPWLKEK